LREWIALTPDAVSPSLSEIFPTGYPFAIAAGGIKQRQFKENKIQRPKGLQEAVYLRRVG
jgi:hypothetical protein